ncbi:MAG: flavin-containing monooxygenase [Acidimicrobiales bacterium]
MPRSRGQGRRLRIVIIGAGPGGLCMAKNLRDAGFEDFVLLERSDGVGGTWNLNRYPGAACDVQSHLYSFSFEIKSDWSRPYAAQPELLAYFEHIAEKYGVLQHCRFGAEVVGAAWDDPGAAWRLQLASGETVEAEVVVSAVGMFHTPVRPDIEGLDRFSGTLFHSSLRQWDHDLAGQTVAVIGSAATAVQFVPEIVKTAAQVYLFQRSANWVLPKPDTPYTDEELAAFRSDPRLLQAVRAEIYRHMDEGMTFSDPQAVAEREAAGLAAIDIVEDPEIRRKLRPRHPFGCKRPLFSNDYYQAFNRPNLELVTERVERINEDAVVTEDGVARRADTLVLATGFATTEFVSAIDVVGRHGRHIREAWADGPVAYLGITTSGFPNLFMLYGPNTNNGSILTMIESQVAHIVAHLERLVEEDLAWVDVTAQAMHDYNEDIDRTMAAVEVWQAGCNGYYRTPTGRIVTQWPFSMSEFHRRTETIDVGAFEVAPCSSVPGGTVSPGAVREGAA